MNMYRVKLIFLLLVSLFLFGCASDEYYRDRAANSAKDFLFANLEHISSENRAYINYTYPEILQAPILPNTAYSQFCFAWNLPSPKITLLVYGTSKNNLRAWSPVRVIFKKYTEKEMKTMKNITLEKAQLLGDDGKTGENIPNRSN